MEGRREEGWLQRRERCLKCRLDERQRLMFQSQVCVGPEGETESDGELTKQNVTTMQQGLYKCVSCSPYECMLNKIEDSLQAVRKNRHVHSEERVVNER